MLDNKFYNPILVKTLNDFFKEKDWEGLVVLLKRLTNKDFRAAGEIIGSQLMPEVSTVVFWQAFYELSVYHSKAFLVTMLKSAELRKRQKGLTLLDEGFGKVAMYLTESGTEIDRMKFVTFMLQVFPDEPNELEHLLKQLKIDASRVCVDYLLRVCNMAAYYLLFLSLRTLEHDKDYLTRCCLFLMKKGDSLSFNLASVMKVYFDLVQVKGTFSLNLNPYQFGRLELSYENFKKILQSI